MAETTRILWIDIAKGIGITLMVIAHNWEPSHDVIFWFHMPLFFVISGYLYRPTSNYKAYFKKKFFSLLVPYIAYLLLLSLPEYWDYMIQLFQQPSVELLNSISLVTAKKAYGGGLLTAQFSVFWFVTCLFITQQIYNILYTRLEHRSRILLILIIFMYITALLNYFFFSSFPFPWGINIAAMAIPFYYIGDRLTQINIDKRVMPLCFGLVALAFLLEGNYGEQLKFGMKGTKYGVPVISFVLALSFVILVFEISKITLSFSIPKRIFSKLGEASIVIMYLHWGIGDIVGYFIQENPFLRIVFGLLVPILFYDVFLYSSFTKQVFLGIRTQKSTQILTGS